MFLRDNLAKFHKICIFAYSFISEHSKIFLYFKKKLALFAAGGGGPFPP